MHPTRSIHVLSDQTIRKIAAGEVIERPHSIVKELMENAVDAFATHVQVQVHKGGMEEICVIDDGVGLQQEDLPLTVVKNATSKITSDKDLFDIRTNGFRGEALSSISSVSRFEITSKHQNASDAFALKVEGGKPPVIKPAARQTGTTVVVKDLFFNVPARRKFLRTPNTEYGHILKTFKKTVLAHPQVRFTLQKDGKQVLDLASTETFLDRVAQLYSENITQALMPIDTAQGPIRILGLASNMRNELSKPSEIWLFVNQRWVQDRVLHKAVLEGYRSARLDQKFPHVFLYIDLPPSMFDINVHPTKSEVRFQDPQTLFRMISSSIQEALSQGLAHHHAGISLAKKTHHPTQREINKLFHSPAQDPSPAPKQALSENTPSSWNHVQEHVATESQGFFSSLTYLTVLDGTFLVCKNESTLVLIDQHAAHERVLFEKFSRQWAASQKLSQQELIPLHIEFEPQDFEALQSVRDIMSPLGFDWEPFGASDVLVRAIPVWFDKQNIQGFLQQMAQEVSQGLMPTQDKDVSSHILSTLACHAAVRAHDRLLPIEIEKLFHDLDHLDVASYCPHGRPTFIELTLKDLDVLFQRTL